MAENDTIEESGDDAAPIPLSALQHAVYCPRQAALIHLERLWAENRFTAEGQVLHSQADKPGKRTIKGVRRVTALPLVSRRLGIAGVADLVEFHGVGADHETPYPVEYKRGKPKKHNADAVQLCAQGLCLEEMTGQAVPEGALFYAETKRRVVVPFDAALRDQTHAAIEILRTIFTTQKTPPPTLHRDRCRACSLADLCRPKDVIKSARQWRLRMINSLLDEVGDLQ